MKTFAQTFSNKTLDATCDVSAATGTAPAAAQFVTLATHASLTGERILTAGDGLALADGGANGNATLTPDPIDRVSKRVRFVDDCWATDGFSDSFLPVVAGTGATIDNTAVTETGVFGVWDLITGTTTTGAAAIQSGHLSSFSLGQGPVTFETKIKVPTLSTVGEEFILRIGLGDSVTGTTTDCVMFKYDRLTSVNWIKETKSNGTVTTVASSTAVGTGWIKLKIVVNAAGTSAEFFIAGSKCWDNSHEYTNGAGRELTVMSSLIKSAGPTSRTARIDYIVFDMDLTTPR